MHSLFRWPQLYHTLQAGKIADSVVDQDEIPQQWLSLVQQKTEITAKVHTELNSMSVICYPHGDPPLALMNALVEALVSNNNFYIVEDKLLEILFHSQE